jgi:hypothetical protein
VTHGPSVGDALLAYARQLAGGDGPLSSYKAKGWHAQISALTGNRRGDAAATAVGLNPSRATLVAWLAERQEPSKANREKIDAAYSALARRFPAQMKEAVLKITGEIEAGPNDVRHRTLKINGKRGDWDAIEEAWDNGTLTPEKFEELYIFDVIVPDIGVSETFEFPGSSYDIQ